MFSIHIILSTFLTIIRLSLINKNIPQRTDSYESYSNPVICMELTHYYPTGPAYLYTSLAYNYDSNNADIKSSWESARYAFKRLDIKCNHSIIFPTLRGDFQNLNIRIKISLSLKNDVAIFDYKFETGFTPGVYELLDCYKNFLVTVTIIDKSKNYLGFPAKVDDDINLLITYNSKNVSHLCVITYKNSAVVLKSEYRSNSSFGFIYNLQTRIFRNKKYLGEHNYPAYLCYKNAEYPEIPIVFIIDKENFSLELNIHYRSYVGGVEKYGSKKYELFYPNFGYVHSFKYIPKKFIKFFITGHRDYKKCADGSFAVLYVSEDGKPYLAELVMKIKILPYIETIRNIYLSPKDPCNELE